MYPGNHGLSLPPRHLLTGSLDARSRVGVDFVLSGESVRRAEKTEWIDNHHVPSVVALSTPSLADLQYSLFAGLWTIVNTNPDAPSSMHERAGALLNSRSGNYEPIARLSDRIELGGGGRHGTHGF